MPIQTRLLIFLKLGLSLISLTLVVSVLSSCSGSSTGSIGSESPPSTDAPKLLSVTPLTKTVALGATLSLEASGGNEPYIFDVYYGNGSVTSSAAIGTYQAPSAQGSAVVRVQDAVGNTGYANVEIIDAPVIQPTSKTLAVTNKFPFAVLSGKAPYTFLINSGEGTINSTTGEFTAAVNAGAVVVRVTDADGRTADANVTVNAALSFTNKNVYVEKTNTYTLTATGGVAPYSYYLAAGAGSVDKTTGAYTAPSALGSASIYVFDSLGNVDLAIVNITANLGISPTSALIAKNTNLSFSAIGGVPPYSYTIQTGGVGTISALTGEYTSPAGTGSATVRVTDGLGNTSDASVTVTNNLSFSVANLILAVGNSFDFATIVNGGMAPLTYTVPSSQGIFTGSTYTAPNTPGVYTITVTDSQVPTPNTVTTIVAVNSALVLLPATTTVAVGAQKSLSASGGVPPYTYSVQSGGGSLNAGIYTAPDVSGSAVILVTDARGNTATASVNIQAALAIVPTTKTLSSGEGFTFTATGGNTPYSFSLVSGSGTINSSTGLYTSPGSSGLATVRVEDAAGNRKDALITILNPLYISPPAISLIKNASITFTASGGAGPYSFSVASGEGSVNATTGVFTASATAGSSTVRVTDSLGSITDAAVTVYDGLSISPFTKSLAVNQTFTFTANGGLAPYAYSLVSGVGSISSSGAYSASTAGAAIVRVTDAGGNTSDATISVNSALAINPTSKTLGVNNQFTFSATGGVVPYAFSVLSGGGTITAAGDYKAPATSANVVVRVTDSASSTADATVTVNEALAISPTNTTLAAGGTQNFITAGGVGPYVYSVVSGGGSFTSSTYTAAAIASGANVNILVTDVLGNTANASITINPITVTIGSPNNSDLITSSNKASFTVSGTCSESGRAVNVSTTGGVTATPNCAGGVWSTNLNLTAVADGAVTITATHTNVNTVAATPAMVTLTKDGSNPAVTIATPTNGSYIGTSLTVTGTCTKQGPVTIAITGGITANTTCESNSYTKTLDLTSAADGALTITVAHTDNAGNAATPATVNVTKDSITPAITAFTVTNNSPTNTSIYSLTFTATDTPSHYCILENSTTLGNCTWTSVALPTAFTVSSTLNAKVLSAWVKDLAGNISTRSDSNSVTLDTSAPAAPSSLSLSTPSTSPNNVTTPIIQVDGVSVNDTVSIYTDGSCAGGNLKGSATVTTGTSVAITSSVLTDNNYTFYAKTVNAASTASSCSTANVNYNLDTVAPTAGTISVNGGAAYATSTTVPLTLSAVGANQMYITNTSGCASGGVYEAYATSKASWTLATANATNTVYVKFKDTAGNESSCLNDSILHDTTGPGAPTGLSLGSVPTNDTTTPTLTWTAASDSGSGVASYQVQVYKTPDNTAVSGCSTWATATSGTAITCSAAAFTNAIQYYMKVRAVDAAGNIGAESVVSANWTATTDGCLAASPTPGTVCAGGAIYLGSLSPGATSGTGTDKYMTTPGGCGEIPGGQKTAGINSPAGDYPNADFTPTCSGTDSLAKYWNDGSAAAYDIPSITNYTATIGTGNGASNIDANYGGPTTGNTPNIVAITDAGQGGYHAAARYCDKLSYGGYTDWYLPNRYELNLMWTNVASIPGLDVSGAWYWSSTEYQHNSAWQQRLSDGYQTADFKSNVYGVYRLRCVRRF